MEKNFPNGFESWKETFFEIVSALALELAKDEPSSTVIAERQEAQGSGGMYELAEELADKFEKQFEGRVWDGDWLDAIDDFLRKELA